MSEKEIKKLYLTKKHKKLIREEVGKIYGYNPVIVLEQTLKTKIDFKIFNALIGK